MAGTTGDGAGELDGQPLDGVAQDRDLHFRTGTIGNNFGCFGFAPIKPRPDDEVEWDFASA